MGKQRTPEEIEDAIARGETIRRTRPDGTTQLIDLNRFEKGQGKTGRINRTTEEIQELIDRGETFKRRRPDGSIEVINPTPRRTPEEIQEERFIEESERKFERNLFRTKQRTSEEIQEEEFTKEELSEDEQFIGKPKRFRRSREELQEAIDRGDESVTVIEDGKRTIFNRVGRRRTQKEIDGDVKISKFGSGSLFMSNLSETGQAGEMDFRQEKRKKLSFEEARFGFMGFVNHKTMFTVGEKNKKEFVSVKPKNNIFSMNNNFNFNPFGTKTKKKKNTFGFDFNPFGTKSKKKKTVLNNSNNIFDTRKFFG